MVAGLGIGDLEVEIVTETGDAVLFEGVEIDGSGHDWSFLCYLVKHEVWGVSLVIVCGLLYLKKYV